MARAADVGVAYSVPSSPRNPDSVTVIRQISCLRGRFHTNRSPTVSRPARTTSPTVTRFDVRRLRCAIGLPLRLCQGSQLPRIDVPRLCDQLDDLVLPQLQELRRQLLKFADHARQRELA